MRHTPAPVQPNPAPGRQQSSTLCMAICRVAYRYWTPARSWSHARPCPAPLQAAGLDFVVSSDSVASRTPQGGHDGLDPAPDPHSNLNTGIYFVRGSPGGGLVAGRQRLVAVVCRHEGCARRGLACRGCAVHMLCMCCSD